MTTSRWAAGGGPRGRPQLHGVRGHGTAFDPPAVRKERLGESVEIVRALLDGRSVSYSGTHYRLDQATTLTPLQEHVPLLVGVNGRAALAHAVRHADIVAPTMLGRTREDGHHYDVRWEATRLDDTIAWMRPRRAAAGTPSSSTRSCRPSSSPTTVTAPPPPSPGVPGSTWPTRCPRRSSVSEPTPRSPAPSRLPGALGLQLLQRPRRDGVRSRHPRLRDATRRWRVTEPAQARCDRLGGQARRSRPDGPSRVRSGSSSRAPTRKQMAPTNVPRLVRATLSSSPLDVT